MTLDYPSHLRSMASTSGTVLDAESDSKGVMTVQPVVLIADEQWVSFPIS